VKDFIKFLQQYPHYFVLAQVPCCLWAVWEQALEQRAAA